MEEKQETTRRKELAMIKKTLLGLGLAVAMAVSTGAAVAAAQDDTTTSDTTTVRAVDQDRDQTRDCDLCDGSTDRTRDRDCDLAATGTGGAPVRDRVHANVDGTGPRHEGPVDGIGRQFGRSGR